MVTATTNRIVNIPSQGVVCQVEDVTPQLAAQYLEANTNNYRSVIDTDLRRLKADLLAGRGKLTPDAIAFTVDGVLVNGQHRLKAIVQTGVALKLLVVRNFPSNSESDPCIDRGSRRSAASDLRHKDYKYPIPTAAAVRLLGRIYLGNSIDGGSTTITDSAVSAIVARNPSINASVIECITSARNRACADTPLAVFYWLAQFDNTELAKEAVDVFLRRVESKTTHPFAAAREALMNNRNIPRGKRNETILNILFNCWDNLKAGVDVVSARRAQSVKIPSESRIALEEAMKGLL